MYSMDGVTTTTTISLITLRNVAALGCINCVASPALLYAGAVAAAVQTLLMNTNFNLVKQFCNCDHANLLHHTMYAVFNKQMWLKITT